MSRNNPPDSIQTTLHHAFKAAGGLEEVSRKVMLAVSTLSECTVFHDTKGKRGGLGLNYVDLLCQQSPDAAAIMADHFARLAGGTFRPFDAEGPRLSALQHASALFKEVGEAGPALLAFTESGNATMTRKELQDVIDAARAAMRDLDARSDGPVSLRTRLATEGGEC